MEVLTDGASAVYGTDAVAGVINVITKRNYQGAEIKVSTSANDDGEFNRNNINGSFGFGGEESAGASFLRTDGTVWTTDKDGIVLALLAAEITARTGRTPSERYADLVARHGEPAYARIDAPADREQKARLAALTAADVTATDLAGHPITAVLTEAPGNGAPIGGLKVTTDRAWFAARPSGTEDVYKIYAESFDGPEHLAQVQREAKEVVDAALGA